MTAKLKLIKNTHRPVAVRPDIYDYEHEQRRKIMSKDWGKVHTAGDRREGLDLRDRPSWKGWMK